MAPTSSSKGSAAAAADCGGVDVSTLMAVDTGRAVNLVVSVHALISLPIQIAAAMYLLYTQVGGGVWEGEWEGGRVIAR